MSWKPQQYLRSAMFRGWAKCKRDRGMWTGEDHAFSQSSICSSTYFLQCCKSKGATSGCLGCGTWKSPSRIILKRATILTYYNDNEKRWPREHTQSADVSVRRPCITKNFFSNYPGSATVLTIYNVVGTPVDADIITRSRTYKPPWIILLHTGTYTLSSEHC